jgi:flagellar biosynthesis protein FliR
MAELVTALRGSPLVFLLVLARVGGLIGLAPMLGGRRVPRTARCLLAAACALCITPLHATDAGLLSATPLEALAMLGREAMLGLILGLSLLTLGAGLKLAGHLVGQLSGLSLLEFFDPDQTADAAGFGRCFELVAIAAFMLIGGHRQVLAAVLDTFVWLPPGATLDAAGLFETFVQMVSQSFVLGIRAAAPVVVALLAATLVMGLVSRAWPQLHAFSMGFSLNAMLAVAVLSLSLGGAAWVYQEHTEAAIEAVRTALASAHQCGHHAPPR